MTGVLVQQDGRILVLRPDEEQNPLEIPFNQMNRLELGSCCNRAAGWGIGALIGMSVAIGGGMILQTLPSSYNDGPNMAMAGAVLVGVPLGVLFGGFIGMAALAPERWEEVPLP